uniref:Troponin I, fast skeletal muscle n=1 Tax=Bos mutus grunniens TaxID=30521 RepID=A0A8B9X5N9_BOSMU
MLQIAATELEKEEAAEAEKQNYLSEHCPPLHLPGSMSEVQELCRQLHAKIDAAEEEKYDMEIRVQKSTKELEDMNQKLSDLRGKSSGPTATRRMSADAMLKALLGSKHKVCMDLRANLKQVKKEDTEKVGCPASGGRLSLGPACRPDVGSGGGRGLSPVPPAGARPAGRGRLEEEHRGEVGHGGPQEDVRDRVLGPHPATAQQPCSLRGP